MHWCSQGGRHPSSSRTASPRFLLGRLVTPRYGKENVVLWLLTPSQSDRWNLQLLLSGCWRWGSIVKTKLKSSPTGILSSENNQSEHVFSLKQDSRVQSEHYFKKTGQMSKFKRTVNFSWAAKLCTKKTKVPPRAEHYIQKWKFCPERILTKYIKPWPERSIQCKKESLKNRSKTLIPKLLEEKPLKFHSLEYFHSKENLKKRFRPDLYHLKNCVKKGKFRAGL
jgi:hypothetical protein